MKRVVASVAVVLCTGHALADELYVPQDYDSLAAAAAAASPGDVIVLDEGVYEGHVLLPSFNIRIRGAGIGLTTIVPGPQPVNPDLPLLRWFDNGAESVARTDGYTLQGVTLVGYASGDPNDQNSYREGLSVQGTNIGRFTMDHVRFEHFYVPNQTVCEILTLNSFEATDCQFEDASGEDGSMYLNLVDDVLIRRCSFVRNSGYSSPLSVIVADSVLIDGCFFLGTASMSLSRPRSSLFVALAPTVVRNSTFGAGGPDATSPTATAGHIQAFSSELTLEHCAFGDGLLLTDMMGSTVNYQKCIGLGLPSVGGNLIAHPGFTDPGDPGQDGLWRTDDDNTGDLTPAFDSPMIDAASGAAYTPGDVDLLGNPRLVDVAGVANTGDEPLPYLDLGAIERQEPTICLPDVNNDGMLTSTDFTAWMDAFHNNLPECDQNADGSCTPTDFTAWIANYNAGC